MAIRTRACASPRPATTAELQWRQQRMLARAAAASAAAPLPPLAGLRAHLAGVAQDGRKLPLTASGGGATAGQWMQRCAAHEGRGQYIIVCSRRGIGEWLAITHCNRSDETVRECNCMLATGSAHVQPAPCCMQAQAFSTPDWLYKHAGVVVAVTGLLVVVVILLLDDLLLADATNADYNI
jgi:hypothetical protein